VSDATIGAIYLGAIGYLPTRSICIAIRLDAKRRRAWGVVEFSALAARRHGLNDPVSDDLLDEPACKASITTSRCSSASTFRSNRTLR